MWKVMCDKIYYNNKIYCDKRLAYSNGDIYINGKRCNTGMRIPVYNYNVYKYDVYTCVDCIDCDTCLFCIDCQSCTDCTGCINCNGCYKCESCKDLAHRCYLRGKDSRFQDVECDSDI